MVSARWLPIDAHTYLSTAKILAREQTASLTGVSKALLECSSHVTNIVEQTQNKPCLEQPSSLSEEGTSTQFEYNLPGLAT